MSKKAEKITRDQSGTKAAQAMARNKAGGSVRSAVTGKFLAEKIKGERIQSTSSITVGDSSSDLLLRHTVKEAHDPLTGLLDAKRFAKVMGVSTSEMAKILERTPRGLQKNPTASKLQKKMRDLIPIYIALLDRFDRSDEYVRIWLRAPHPELDNETPIACLENGHLEVVESLIHSMGSGQPS